MTRPTFGRYTSSLRDESLHLDKLTKEKSLKTESVCTKIRVKNVKINSMAISGLYNHCPMSLSTVRGTKVLGRDNLLDSECFRTNVNCR